MPITVVGIDGWKSGWIGAFLSGDVLAFAHAPGLSDLVAAIPSAEAIVVDVPIGTPRQGRRRCDIEARRFVGRRGSSVFSVPPEPVLRAPTYQEALALCREQYGYGISTQAYALGSKILEAAEVALELRLVEGHPEVSFAAVKGSPLDYAKRTWNGQRERLRLLASAGITAADTLPDPVGSAPPDDVLDAAVMAWTARRVAAGTAMSLPDPPEEVGGQQLAIWY